MTMLAFPEYAPDVSPFGEEESQIIQNVFARKDGYGPVMGPSVYSAALASACRGYFYARNADASITVFAATATKLYKLNNTDFTWTDVSKGGGIIFGRAERRSMAVRPVQQFCVRRADQHGATGVRPHVVHRLRRSRRLAAPGALHRDRQPVRRALRPWRIDAVPHPVVGP